MSAMSSNLGALQRRLGESLYLFVSGVVASVALRSGQRQQGHSTAMALLRTIRVLLPPAFLASRRMSSVSAPLLLSPRQANELKSKDTPVAFLDTTWFMPNSPRNAKQEFTSKRIPGSHFLDLDEVASSHELGLKHMMPDKHTFAHACGTGVHDGWVQLSFLKFRPLQKNWAYHLLHTLFCKHCARIAREQIYLNASQLRHPRCLLVPSSAFHVQNFWTHEL